MLPNQKSIRLLRKGSLVLCLIFIFSFLNSCKVQARQIINAKPYAGLTVHTKQPVYYYVKDTLYFARHGEINFDRPIWQGTVSERFYNDKLSISPDSKYVMIRHEEGLDVIDSVGNKIAGFKNFIKSTTKGEPDSYLGKNFQWSADSKALYLKKRSEASTSVADAIGSSLVKLDLTDGTLHTL